MTAKNRELMKRGRRVEGGRAEGSEETAGTEAARTETPDRAADERTGSLDGEDEARPAPVPDVDGEGARNEGGHDGRTPVLEEMLGLLKVIEQRTGKEKTRGGGPSKAAFDRLVKSVEELGAKGTVTKALRKAMGRRNREFRRAIETAAKLTRELRNYRSDLERWVERDRRSRRRWAGLALAAGFPAFMVLGVLVEQQFQVVPLHDPTGGWRGHVWEQYGKRIVDCAAEAMSTDAEGRLSAGRAAALTRTGRERMDEQ